MKKTLILAAATLTLLTFTSTSHASPRNMKHRHAQITKMCQDKPTRILMIHELMQTKEGKTELSQMLKDDTEFRSLYETMTVNPG